MVAQVSNIHLDTRKKIMNWDKEDDDKPVKTGKIYNLKFRKVRFDPVNFGTVVIKSRKTPCEHIESVEVGISTITTYYSTYFAYCPDCGVKF